MLAAVKTFSNYAKYPTGHCLRKSYKKLRSPRITNPDKEDVPLFTREEVKKYPKLMEIKKEKASV